MEQMEFYLSNPPCLSIPVSDADKLLNCSNLLCTKLYLYLLRVGKSVTPEQAATDLTASVADIKKAGRELKNMGLMSTAGKGTVPPEEKIPEYEKNYIVNRSKDDEIFKALLLEAERVVGHQLGGPDLNILFGIYDHLGLPAEVIFMLLTACQEQVQEAYGPGRMPTMRKIEQQAYIWAREEIMTLDLAEAYLNKRRERKNLYNQIKRMMDIWDRKFVKSELNYINDWLDKGFGLDALAIAYDRTITQTTGMNWAYMNRIIQNWHEKGLHTPEEIEAGDKPLGKTKQPIAPQSFTAVQGGEKERLMKLLEDI